MQAPLDLVSEVTAYHAKYFAFELTKRCASDSVEKLATALSDAQVDLNPHQIEAALFSFRSPLSKGAIRADDVGLGKTPKPESCSPRSGSNGNESSWSFARPICVNSGPRNWPASSSCHPSSWKPVLSTNADLAGLQCPVRRIRQGQRKLRPQFHVVQTTLPIYDGRSRRRRECTRDQTQIPRPVSHSGTEWRLFTSTSPLSRSPRNRSQSSAGRLVAATCCHAFKIR